MLRGKVGSKGSATTISANNNKQQSGLKAEAGEAASPRGEAVCVQNPTAAATTAAAAAAAAASARGEWACC